MTLVRFRVKQTNTTQHSVNLIVFVSFNSISAVNITFISTREVTWKLFSERKNSSFFFFQKTMQKIKCSLGEAKRRKSVPKILHKV